jgi:nucleotide-binding universal stress UspA family protein
MEILMYETILVTLDTSRSDEAIIKHIKALASTMISKVVLLHVADGWAARTFGADAVSPEITEDSQYLEKVRREFQDLGIPAEVALCYGDPTTEIIKWVHDRQCDLVAMSTHGHRVLADIFLGATASRVQHSIDVPVLLIRSR